jgi:cytochrome c551/c552
MNRAIVSAGTLLAAAAAMHAQTGGPERALLNQYCAGCHNEKVKTAGLALDKMNLARVAEDAEAWEKVVRKLRAGMMPPSGARRPDRTALDAFTSKLETELDRAAAATPNPGQRRCTASIAPNTLTRSATCWRWM